MTQPEEYFFWVLFKRLREWHFPLAPSDYQSLYESLSLGFGWRSLKDLRYLCSTLWAKSRQEQEILFSLFDRLVEEFGWEDWRLAGIPEATQKSRIEQEEPLRSPGVGVSASSSAEHITPTPRMGEQRGGSVAPELGPKEAVSGISVSKLLSELDRHSHSHLVLNPRYSINFREVAQAWRRLRRFVRSGPRTELDVVSTIQMRCRHGVVSPVVLRASRRNAVRLLLFIDRQGSMAPFHNLTDDAVQAATYQSGRFEREPTTFYFHDVPRGKQSAQRTALLESLSERLFPVIDDFLGDIDPLLYGQVYKDPRLLEPQLLSEVLAAPMAATAVVVVSDAGAARGSYDTGRLIDTVAFLRALYTHTPYVVWLNPLPRERWQHSSAAQIARYTPMFPLSKEGLHKTVNVLRGQAVDLEYPL